MSEKVSSFEGFLQKTQEGQWLLCDAPNLKSCCLKKHSLVVLEGDFSRYATGKSVTATGIYQAGTLSQVAIKEKNSPFPYWSIGAVLLIICLSLLIKSRKGRPLPP